ncbi:MAG: ABC transporter permease [Bacteroidales bacterium]|jgi:putative ABC transport system permease protein|nr:ABC transporter permease [Bacteroidales bacterium]MCI1733275.1 ABC transporter permease [Bacteroidales bacterium]
MARRIFVKKFWRISPLVRENLRVALRSIKNNRLRSALTILIVAIGITSLVGILTATDSLKSEVSSSFEKLGASSFTISQQYFGGSSIKSGRIRNNSNITYFQAEEFKRQYDIPAFVSVYNYAEAKTVKRGSLSTSPRVELYGADEDYVPYSNAQIAEGRNFSQQDIKGAAFVCLLGSGVVSTVFKPGEHAVGQSVDLEGVKYRVIGLLASKGQGFGGGGADQSIIVPVTNARSYFFGDNASYEIGVQPRIALEDMSPVYDKAEQIFRGVRRLSPMDEDDFTIDRNESMLKQSGKTLGTITIIAAVIGLITLLGAAVGLMNIMLVSVKERTSEIGVRKAIGASSKMIRQQFLFESIVIAQIGCLLGIVLGVAAGNAVAALMKANFVMPWMWMLLAIVICLIVGISSGYLPAKRAAALDPIEALRYE